MGLPWEMQPQPFFLAAAVLLGALLVFVPARGYLNEKNFLLMLATGVVATPVAVHLSEWAEKSLLQAFPAFGFDSFWLFCVFNALLLLTGLALLRRPAGLTHVPGFIAVLLLALALSPVMLAAYALLYLSIFGC